MLKNQNNAEKCKTMQNKIQKNYDECWKMLNNAKCKKCTYKAEYA